MKRSNLGDVLTATIAIGTVLAANLPHPSSREGHLYRQGRNIVTSSCSVFVDAPDHAYPSNGAFSSPVRSVSFAPAEIGRVTPHAMHNHR